MTTTTAPSYICKDGKTYIYLSLGEEELHHVIIRKQKCMGQSTNCTEKRYLIPTDLSRFWLSCLDPLVLSLPKLFNHLAFQSFDFESTSSKVIPETRRAH